jgi:hypothetical protein
MSIGGVAVIREIRWGSAIGLSHLPQLEVYRTGPRRASWVWRPARLPWLSRLPGSLGVLDVGDRGYIGRFW